MNKTCPKVGLLIGSIYLLAFCYTAGSQAVPFNEFLKAYPQVERYLQQNVASDDVDENMSKAREFLQQLQVSQSKSPLSASDQQRALIEALQTFISLSDLGDEKSCKFARYIPLYYNYLASRSSQDRASLRVARITDQFALRHAQLCTDFYGVQVRDRYDEMLADNQLKSIERLLDSALRSATGPNMIEDLVQHFQEQNAPVLGSSHGQLIHSILLEQTRGKDPDSDFLLSNCDPSSSAEQQGAKDEALRQLFDKHIRQPCKSLVHKLRDVMEPAAFDALYQPKRQDDLFYIVWARYKLCDTMSGQVREKLLASLAESTCSA